MNRRFLLSTAAPLALAVAACSASQLATASTDLTTVSGWVLIIGTGLQAIALPLSVVSPAAGAALAGITGYLSDAEITLSQIKAATTAATAQTPAKQAVVAFNAGIKAIQTAFQQVPPTPQVTQEQLILTGLQGIVNDLAAFAGTGVVPAPAPVTAMVTGPKVKIFGT